MALISRNSFARTELHRDRVASSPHKNCSWCGTQKILFQYYTETDGGTKSEDRNLFCSTSCRKEYQQ